MSEILEIVKYPNNFDREDSNQSANFKYTSNQKLGMDAYVKEPRPRINNSTTGVLPL